MFTNIYTVTNISHYAEQSGYWKSTNFLDQVREQAQNGEEITFYDSNTGNALFVAPRGRSFEEFVKESTSHGWPSFRDDEVGFFLLFFFCFASEVSNKLWQSPSMTKKLSLHVHTFLKLSLPTSFYRLYGTMSVVYLMVRR
jgi:hypothetical protein